MRRDGLTADPWSFTLKNDQQPVTSCRLAAMGMRQRAILPVDKQERHDAILDAAERVLSLSTERGASMAEVADEAKLAKGTVYLYFSSKEELLLALHERNIDAFFTPLIAMVEAREPVDFDRV